MIRRQESSPRSPSRAPSFAIQFGIDILQHGCETKDIVDLTAIAAVEAQRSATVQGTPAKVAVA